MVKQRFSTSDVAAEVGCLRQKALGMRLANLYDINAKVWPEANADLTEVFFVLSPLDTLISRRHIC